MRLPTVSAIRFLRVSQEVKNIVANSDLISIPTAKSEKV